jgi:rod shape-determining protein MreB and related proteins
MGFFNSSKDIAIDLGTSNTVLYVKGKGILLKEPTVVAVNTENNKVLAIGSEAKKMIGRTPKYISTLSPVKSGAIADFDMTEQMLKMFVEKAAGKGAFSKSRVVICHPSGLTEVEKRSIYEAANQSGARKIMLIEDTIAAALGAELPVNEPIGSMIIDIGGGTTEISVISLGGIATSRTLKVAGKKLDETIINHVKKEFNLSIGEITAENMKIEMGSVHDCGGEVERSMKVSGRDLITGLPRVITITETEIRYALKESAALIIDGIRATLEQTAPELAADIMDKGIILSGGGALLRGLDKLVQSEIHIPTYIAENPIDCVVLGAGKCLDTIRLYK